MKTIFDPTNRWIGGSPLVLAEGNKRPVAIDDAITVAKDGGPVTVAVLANDFDPESAPLTLISASAALGTAVAEADNTVTYTPPPGLAGFDTVVYTIADDLAQTTDGQINVTITEPQLSVVIETDNTMSVIAETGSIDLTVTEPAGFAGTTNFHTNDFNGGPVNLSPPTLSGTAEAGQVLTAAPGLWAYDTVEGAPAQSWQWQRGGADIAGETGTTYTVQAQDLGPGISVREIQSDTQGVRFADSAVVGDGFLPSVDTLLQGWWDATDAGTISASGGEVSSWADKSGGAALAQSTASRRPTTGTRTLNGSNVLDFDGAAFLERAETVPASGNIAFHMALAVDSTASDFEALLALDATNDFQIDANSSTQFDGRLNAAGIGNSVNLTGGPFSGGLILSAVFDRTGAASAEVFISNVSRGSLSYLTAIDASAVLSVMTNRSQNAWVNGAVAELIVTGDVTNRADYHTYLANKWGLT